MKKRILILGASGQIGTDLTLALREKHGGENVIASDIKSPSIDLGNGPFEIVDASREDDVRAVVDTFNVDEIYNLVAMLSATAEKHPEKAWDLNMKTLFITLNLLKEGQFKKLFWPSSIAVFGGRLPDKTAEQHSITEPTTVYGISKLAGERWCNYYANNYNLDIRSLRYPGLIGYKQDPGGGTTDYAVEIFHAASKGSEYRCFLDEHTILPMMYMEDAINATIKMMEAPKEQIKIKSSYNINAMSFSPQMIYNEIKQHVPDFSIAYQPDKRDELARSWPQYIDDRHARIDWGWQPKFNIKELVNCMFRNLKSLVI